MNIREKIGFNDSISMGWKNMMDCFDLVSTILFLWDGGFPEDWIVFIWIWNGIWIWKGMIREKDWIP
jgi:hypothetical protein